MHRSRQRVTPAFGSDLPRLTPTVDVWVVIVGRCPRPRLWVAAIRRTMCAFWLPVAPGGIPANETPVRHRHHAGGSSRPPARRLRPLAAGTGRAVRAAVQHRARVARIRRIHHGVYAYGHRRLTAHGHRLAAVLACGPGAVLSHRSAAAVWELLPSAQTRLHVTVPGTSRRRRVGIRVDRTRDLPDDDITLVDGIPITTVTRTLCDLAGGGSVAQLRRAVHHADRSGRLDLALCSGLSTAVPGAAGRQRCARSSPTTRPPR